MIGKEAALLGQYVAEVIKHWRAFLGTAFVVGLIWLAAHYGTAIRSRLVPLMPHTVAPWLTQNRLIALSVLIVLAVAQYLAWKDAWLKRGTPESPYLPKGLRLEGQTVSHVRGDTAPERTEFALVASEDLRGKAIRVCCDGPIYSKNFITNANPGEYAWREDIRDDDTNSAIFDFSSKRLSERPFSGITGYVGSLRSLRVTHVEWAETRAMSLARHRERKEPS